MHLSCKWQCIVFTVGSVLVVLYVLWHDDLKTHFQSGNAWLCVHYMLRSVSYHTCTSVDLLVIHLPQSGHHMSTCLTA